jgi:hypothetical protein
MINCLLSVPTYLQQCLRCSFVLWKLTWSSVQKHILLLNTCQCAALQVQRRAAKQAAEQQQQTTSLALKTMKMSPTFLTMRQKQSGAGLKE